MKTEQQIQEKLSQMESQLPQLEKNLDNTPETDSEYTYHLKKYHECRVTIATLTWCLDKVKFD